MVLAMPTSSILPMIRDTKPLYLGISPCQLQYIILSTRLEGLKKRHEPSTVSPGSVGHALGILMYYPHGVEVMVGGSRCANLISVLPIIKDTKPFNTLWLISPCQLQYIIFSTRLKGLQKSALTIYCFSRVSRTRLGDLVWLTLMGLRSMIGGVSSLGISRRNIH